MKKLFLLTTALVCWPITDAAAQSTASQAEPTGSQIGEIIVTARKREERLQDVPVAVSALDENYLKRNAITSIEGLVSSVPGLTAGQSQLSAGGSLYLRGVGSGTGNGIIDQSVSINIDGVALAQATLMFAGEHDTSRVEILRGPQALFYGKNSPGGVIGFRSNDPGREFESAISVGHTFGIKEYFGSVMLSGPLSDSVGARLFARYSNQEGYYDFVSVPAPVTTPLGLALPSTAKGFPDQSDLFLRGTLMFEPNERFSLRTKALYSHRKMDSYPVGWQRVFCPLGQPNFMGTPISLVAPALNVDDCRLDDKIVSGDLTPAEIASIQSSRADENGIRDVKIRLASAEANYDITDGLRLTGIAGLYDVDDLAIQDQSALPVTILQTLTDTKHTQKTLEGRLASDWDSPLNFMLGAFWENRDSSLFSQIPGRRLERAEQDQSAYSIFGQLAWRPIEKLEISGGARFTHEEKSLRAEDAGGSVVFAPGANKRTFEDTSPEVTVSYKPTSDTLVYAAYKQGFKSGGFDASGGFAPRARAGLNVTYLPEEVEGWEAGFKATLFDRTLRFASSVFSFDYTNLQVTSFDSVAVAVITTNAGAAKVEGVEFDFNWQPPVEGLTFQGAAAFLKGRYGRFVSDCFTGQSIVAGCNVDVVPGGAFEGQDLTGKAILNAPDFSASLGFAYQRPLPGTRLKLSLSGDMKHSSGYQTMQQQMPGTPQPSYQMYNMGVRLGREDDAWEVALIGRNLSDKVIRVIGQSVPLSGRGTGTAAAVPSDALAIMSERGRTVMLQFTIRPSALFGK